MNGINSQLQTPVADEGTGHIEIGAPLPRLDGRIKVTGEARYAAEHATQNMLYGVPVCSSIASGRIEDMQLDAALAVPGVVDILHHGNRPPMKDDDDAYKDSMAPGSGSPFRPLYDDQVKFNGQPIALVVAASEEAARYAASLVRVHYAEEAHETNLMKQLANARPPETDKALPVDELGDVDTAYDMAPITLEKEYHSSAEHHNPIELFATTVIRGDDGHLMVYDKNQSSQNNLEYVLNIFGLDESEVTVRNPYVGGAFGSGLRPKYQLVLAMQAALKLKHSVRVVLSRQEMFAFGHRPETWQRIKLAAERDGTLRAISHEAISETSRFEDYAEGIANWSAMLYACDNIKLDYKVAELDRYTPMDMRAPGAAQGVYALETAMDELSYELKMDPLELRMKNYAERDPVNDLPYSSKELRACYAQGSKRFGWDHRSPQPRSMSEGNELIGWGMATGIWEVLKMSGSAKAVLHANGHLLVSSAASDIGTGTYTVMAMLAAAAMGLPMERVTFQLGDSTLPKAPVEGGSAHVITIGPAVEEACEALQEKLYELAKELPDSPFADSDFKEVAFREGHMQLVDRPDVRIPLEDILHRSDRPQIEAVGSIEPDEELQKKYCQAIHCAVFCEVRVDEALGRVRVSRVVNAVAGGKIMNMKTATSQISGGVVWGISQALHEESQDDPRMGRFMNHNLAEYHISTQADVHDIDVIFVEEDDRIVSRMGAKGLGEIGMLGVAAAIGNAIYHATGRRIRSLPMTPDKIMS